MSRVYRQVHLRGALLLAGMVAAHALACSAGERPRGEFAAQQQRARRFELTDFLASTASHVDSPAASRLLAGQRESWIPEPPTALQSHGRFMGWTLDGSGFYLAQTPAGTTGGQEELVLLSTRGVLPQSLYLSPAGFQIAAVSARGDRIALLRELDPDTTEVLLHDRSLAETRLLLPVDQDARFLPLRFTPDGRRLFLFSDERDEQLQLEILDTETGKRIRRSRPGCEARQLDLSPDADAYSMQWNCAGVVVAAVFETASGRELGPLPLPRHTRLARALLSGLSGAALYEIAANRYPRDLIFVERLDSESLARPLTFGLAPAISAEDLVDSEPVTLRVAGSVDLPAEIWWPRRAPGSPPALVWLEDSRWPPAWREFAALPQFLANRGIAVLRLRLRGAEGFGKRFRHAADGRLGEAAFEDIDAARAELVRRGATPERIAVLGEGSWAGAMAASALVERPGQFVAAADLGGDPDPLRAHNLLPEMPEPARSWWQTRLGDPASEPVRGDRLRLRFPGRLPGLPLFLVVDPAAGAWTPEALTARGAIDFRHRIELESDEGAGKDARILDRLPRAAIEALWVFLSLHLQVET